MAFRDGNLGFMDLSLGFKPPNGLGLLLDANGYSEASLAAAWREKSHQEIAASIVGHIRRAALGEALLPFDQRVTQAMARVHALRAWTPGGLPTGSAVRWRAD